MERRSGIEGKRVWRDADYRSILLMIKKMMDMSVTRVSLP
jgi:hypothetical protein